MIVAKFPFLGGLWSAPCGSDLCCRSVPRTQLMVRLPLEWSQPTGRGPERQATDLPSLPLQPSTLTPRRTKGPTSSSTQPAFAACRPASRVRRPFPRDVVRSAWSSPWCCLALAGASLVAERASDTSCDVSPAQQPLTARGIDEARHQVIAGSLRELSACPASLSPYV